MERKEDISSGAIPKRSNIPAANNRPVETKSSLPRGFNRQSSKSKLVKTAIVKPFRCEAADSKTSLHTGHSRQNVNSADGESNPCKGKARAQRESKSPVEHSLTETTKNMPPVVRYMAHSGIPFLPSPRKQNHPNPFAPGERRKLQSSRTDAKASGSSAADTSVKECALPRKVAAKPKAQLKERPSNRVQKNLVDASKTVLKDAPVLMEKYSGHSGLSFKPPRKLTRPPANPFARNDKEVPKPPSPKNR